MSLLEVIISLAIIGLSMPMIAELSRNAFQSARIARDIVQAELLAESILAKIRVGIIEMEPAFDVPIGLTTINQADIVLDTHAIPHGGVGQPLWVYDVEIVDIDEFLIELAVTVRQNVLEGQRAVVCRLVRWHAIEPVMEED
jgi:hypothetical protein